jgi:LAS superfamily LD-carboxypeptidase LdcB
MRKGGVLIGFFLLFSVLVGISQDSQNTNFLKGAGISTTNNSNEESSIPLSCMNKITFEIRVTNTVKDCVATELSLGASEIKHGLNYPNEIDPQLLVRFQAAKAAAEKDGQKIYIASGFRTLERQKYLFAAAVRKYGSEAEAAKWVAPPYVSHHPWGLAIDVNYPNEPVGAGWLEVNGARFGLCRVYENEWWHFEPVIAPGGTCPALVPNATFTRQLQPASGS